MKSQAPPDLICHPPATKNLSAEVGKYQLMGRKATFPGQDLYQTLKFRTHPSRSLKIAREIFVPCVYADSNPSNTMDIPRTYHGHRTDIVRKSYGHDGHRTDIPNGHTKRPPLWGQCGENLRVLDLFWTAETLRARGSLGPFARLRPMVFDGTATHGQPVGAV